MEMVKNAEEISVDRLYSSPGSSIHTFDSALESTPVLSEELARAEREILQDRDMQGRPLSRVGRMFRCHQGHAGKVKKPKNNQTGCLLQQFSNFMPILRIIPTMNLATLQADVIAGLTVGVMVIPQSMSYASIAGLPYQFGLYAACIPPALYVFFGQSRQLAVGPVAMISLLIESGLARVLSQSECPESYEDGILGEKPQYEYDSCAVAYAHVAVFTAAVVGVVQIIGSVLKLGFLVSFLGHPVTSGFTSAAAIIIGLSQVKHIFGFDLPKSEHFHTMVYNVAVHLQETNWMTLGLGLAWIVFLIGSKKLSRKGGKLTMFGPLAPLISCVLGTVLLLAVKPLRTSFGVKHVGNIPSGTLPPFSVHHWDMQKLASVLPTALSACLIGYMESVAIAKNIAARRMYDVDAGQELLALGIANLVGAMFSCYPVTGSFSRSAVNDATGAATQFAGLVTALIMLCALLFLTPLFFYLPQFALAAIVVSSVIPLVAFGEALKLWRVKEEDFVLWMVAFIGTLFCGVLQGIGLAVGLSLIIVIYESVRPQIAILWRISGTTIYRNIKQESRGVFVPNVFIARIGSSMYFANASYIKEILLSYVEDLEDVNRTEYIVLEMTPVVSLDSTAAHVIQDIVAMFRNRGIQVAFAMVGNRVERALRKANLNEFIGAQWFFPTVNDAVTACMTHQHTKRQSSLQPGQLRLSGVSCVPNYSMEIGFSNDVHHSGTTVFVCLTRDVPLIMNAFVAIFTRHRLAVVRSDVDIEDGDAENLTTRGSRHTYVLRSLKCGGKLDEKEISNVQKDLHLLFPEQCGEANVNNFTGTATTATTASCSPGSQMCEWTEKSVRLEI